MLKYFAKEWSGETFQIFGAGHLLFILGFVLFNLSFIWARNKNKTIKNAYRYFIAAALIAGEGSWQIWNLAVGTWTIDYHLPFHLCAVSTWLAVVMLLTKNYKTYEFIYFLGIAGATQALLTPETGIYGLPHYRVIQTLFTHGSIVTAAIFMTIVEGFRPTWDSLKRLLIWANLFLVIATVVNHIIGSNYMYTMGPPTNPSLIDHLGPWPWYIAVMELMAVVVCILLYLPWHLKDIKIKLQ